MLSRHPTFPRERSMRQATKPQVGGATSSQMCPSHGCYVLRLKKTPSVPCFSMQHQTFLEALVLRFGDAPAHSADAWRLKDIKVQLQWSHWYWLAWWCGIDHKAAPLWLSTIDHSVIIQYVYIYIYMYISTMYLFSTYTVITYIYIYISICIYSIYICICYRSTNSSYPLTKLDESQLEVNIVLPTVAHSPMLNTMLFTPKISSVIHARCAEITCWKRQEGTTNRPVSVNPWFGQMYPNCRSWGCDSNHLHYHFLLASRHSVFLLLVWSIVAPGKKHSGCFPGIAQIWPWMWSVLMRLGRMPSSQWLRRLELGTCPPAQELMTKQFGWPKFFSGSKDNIFSAVV